MRAVLFGQSIPYSIDILRRVATRVKLAGIVEAVGAPRPEPSALVGRAKLALGRPDLRLHARALGVPHFFFVRGQLAGLLEFIRAVRAEVGGIASFPCLLPPALIDAFPRGILNVHPSLLPNYRGPMPVLWQYYNQETQGGVTVHSIDSGEDTGDIVAQEPLAIDLERSGGEYMARAADRGGALLAEAINAIAGGSIARRPQRELPCPFRARGLKRGERLLDWGTQSVAQTFHALQGGYNILPRLLPETEGLLGYTDLTPIGWDTCPPQIAPGRYGWSRAVPFLAHAQGRIFLGMRPSRQRLLRWWR